MINIAVFISGNGSKLQSLINSCNNNISSKISCVIASDSLVPGIKKANEASIKVAVVNNEDYPTIKEFEEQLDNKLRKHKIDLICLANYKIILSEWFVNKWYNKIINVHPSLLPKYKGPEAVKRALMNKDKETGCSVHFVRVECDGGPNILQKIIPIAEGQDLIELKNKVKQLELIAYPEAVNLIAHGKLDMNLYK